MADPSNMKIDWEDFELVPEPRRSLRIIRINRSGSITLNKWLREEIAAKTELFSLDFMVSKRDKRILILKPSNEQKYYFKKDGSKKDVVFSRKLAACGVRLPAQYETAWNEKAGAWVGVLQGELIPDAARQSLTRERKRRKKNESTDK